MIKNRARSNLMRDLAIVGFSIIVAVIIVRSGAVENFLVATKKFEIIGSFIAGLFFTTVFSAAPATVVLGQIAHANSVFLVAFFGALGAVCGDFIIFRFIKHDISADVDYLVKQNRTLGRLKHVFKLRFFRWFIPMLGALVVASPLPDELGLALMGLSKIKVRVFIPLSFSLNFLGIFVIGLVARSI